MTKKQMIEFLSEHFRYDTMNSWNAATSYARNVKLNRLAFPSSEVRNRAYDLLGVDYVFDECGVNELIHAFNEDHNYEYQIGFNGRSGGYMVLYQGGRKPSEYKTRCHDCFQKNYREDTKKCGVCGSTNMRPYQGFETFSYPGKGIDQGEDFSEWDMDSLKSRVKLVKEFDQCCDDCIATFIDYAEHHVVEEETIMVPKKVMVAKEK